MNKTALGLAIKDCWVHTVYSELGGVLLYNWAMKPALVQLTQMRMTVNFGTCMLARFVVDQADNSRGADILIMGGVRTSVKAGLIRAARKLMSEQQSGSISQSATCGFLGGLVNALAEPYSPVLVGDTTSLNTLVGDTTNGLCNVLFTMQRPEQWWAIMRDKVSIGVLRELFKPVADFFGDQAYILLQWLQIIGPFAKPEQENSNNNDGDRLPQSDTAAEGDKLIQGPDKLPVQSPPSKICNSGSSSHLHAGQGQSMECGQHDSSKQLDVCLAGEESTQSS